MVGGLVGEWMAWSVGGRVVRYVGGNFVGDLGADVVLVRLLRCVLVHFLAAER